MSSTIAQTDFSEPGNYGEYLRAEWDLAARDDARHAITRRAIAALALKRVLDLGCGAGQELRPVVADSATLGIGVDLSMQAVTTARALFAAACPQSHVAFVRAVAEALPFADASFDLIVCRLALPYTDNRRTIAEMARVLRPGGAVLLTFHHLRFYLAELREAVWPLRLRAALHACRVLAAGALYHLTGLQPRVSLLGGESFQTLWLLRGELRRHGLTVVEILENSVPAAPSLLIRQSANS